MKRVKRICVAVALAAVGMIGCQQAFAECGIASTYSEGSVTATGERYNHLGVSAAHKSLPFGSVVRVVHQRTGRSITVRINDRGPYVKGRIIDLSTGAKRMFGMDGLAPVCLEVVSYGNGGRVHYASHHHHTRVAHVSHRHHYAEGRTVARTRRYAHAQRHGRRGHRQYAGAHHRRYRQALAGDTRDLSLF